MKYFLAEYLDISDVALTEKERTSKELLWKNACDRYNDYMQKHINDFSKSFLKTYYNGGFHDYKINKLLFDFEGQRNKLNLIINLESHGKRYSFIHKDVINYSASLQTDMRLGFNDYLYGEYYKDENKFWHHNFLFGEYYEMNITCKKFIFEVDT